MRAAQWRLAAPKHEAVKTEQLGNLTPLAPTMRKSGPNRFWRFRCHCGREVDRVLSVVRWQVSRGYVPSCRACRLPPKLTRACSLCCEQGHDRRNCPAGENMTENITTDGANDA
jgi:hypothetical protein